MPIEPKNLRHWMDHFYGYGNWEAPIWFVNYEDGGGDLPEEVAEKLDFFQSSHPSASQPTLCDIRELYKHNSFQTEGAKAGSYANLYEYRFGPQAKINGVWRNLVAFAHAYQAKPVPEMLSYQKKVFAIKDAALIKLFPLPSPHNHAWYYSWLDMPEFPYLKSRMKYEEHLYPIRMKTILDNMTRHKPRLVLMYGMNAINLIKKSVLEFFPQSKFAQVKSVKMKTPQHHRVEINGTTLLLTTQIPALRHNRVESGFDWVEFGKTVRG